MEFFRKIKIKCQAGNGELLIDLHGPNMYIFYTNDHVQLQDIHPPPQVCLQYIGMQTDSILFHTAGSL